MPILAKDPSKLSYSARIFVIFKYLGQLSILSSILSCVPLIASLIFEEYSMSIRYAAVIFIFAIFALLSRRIPDVKNLQNNETFAIIALSFILTSFVLIIPFMGANLSPMDAWFEAVSSITTTGLSTSDGTQNGKTFFFARAFTQWYGGIGIVVMSLGLAMQPSMIAKNLSKKISGEEDFISSTKRFGIQMASIYAILTLCCLVALWPFAPSFYTAVVHTFATVSTGGFSDQPDSLQHLSTPFQGFTSLFSILSAISFPLFWHLKNKKKMNRFFASIQLWALLICLFLICLALYLIDLPTSFTKIKDLIVTAISAQTTTGFSALSIGSASAGSKIALIASMAIGGSTQSTAGGFKLLRLCIFLKSVQLILFKTSLPKHAVTFDQLGGEPLSAEEKESCFAMILLFLSTVFLSWIAFVISGFEPLSSLFEVVSATGTVGLSSGITSVDLPSYLKTILCIDMFLGRLEMITLLILFVPRTFIGRRMHS